MGANNNDIRYKEAAIAASVIFGNYRILWLEKKCIFPLIFFMILKHLWLFLSLFFTSHACFSQKDIAGIWQGRYVTAFSGLGAPKLVVEIYDFKDSMFTGITHLYYSGNMYEHYKIVGWFSKKDSLLVFREASTIAVDLGVYGNCLGTYFMQLKKNGNKFSQSGWWKPNIHACTQDSKIFIEKNTEEIKQDLPLKKLPLTKKPLQPVDKLNGKIISPVITTTTPEPVTATTIPVIKNVPVITPQKIARRETDVQSLLEISPGEKDSIKVEIYDNGEIDGDSVSVYEGQTLRVDKKMISLKPIVFYVSLNKNINPITHLRLVAESLGTIPPCTALMIVTTKSKRYEVHLSSNFNKNATVELFLKE